MSNRIRKPKRRNKNNSVVFIVVAVILLVAIITTILALTTGTTLLSIFETLFNDATPEVNTATPWENDIDNGSDTQPSANREKGNYNFLVVGRDVVALNTDVMMLVNLDLEDEKMTIMQMPRDTFITIDGSVRKLNSVFGMYYNSSSASDTEGRIKSGMEGLASVLSSNLAINIDFYAYMNLEGFGEIVDAIGGVDMYVPYRMYYTDVYQNPPLYIDLYEGQQTLDGDMAQQFVRFRSSYIHGDTSRQDAQKLFMTAFMESFKNNINITNVAPIVNSILGNLSHNLSASDCVYFVKEAMQMDFSNISMLSAPNTPYTYYGGSYVVIHRNAMYDVVNENFNLFDTSIPESSFDKNKNFTLTTDAGVNAVYNSTEEFEGTHSAEDIQQDGIDIDRAW